MTDLFMLARLSAEEQGRSGNERGHRALCGWFVTAQSSHEVTDVAEPGRKQNHKTLGEQIDLFRK